ncbi:hypothetical protein IAR55_004726 [Kwoniella newhampshirensis]|uniref:Complex 1 LYR protein n=1 Tax=Kwoniella newhampshirensis TaxID=1651941 RepID=A0AAW0YMR9_9TREE
MSTTPIPHLYRSLLRELRLASRLSRTKRNPAPIVQLRSLVASSSSAESLAKTFLETRDFLRASRIHGELLKRYNPIHGMSEEERIVATANRVGLNTPIEYKKE